MKLTIDFETRSAVSLKDCGVFRYAEDPTTEVLCLAVKQDNYLPKIWINPKFDHLGGQLPRAGLFHIKELIEKADVIEAHNMQFELAIWPIMVKQFKFPPLPLEKVRCSAAKAAAVAIPRSLAMACAAMGLEQQKDQAGHKLMLQMCKPRKPRKAERASDPDWERTLYWWEDDDRFLNLCRYCIQDVEAEHELSENLPDLRTEEQQLWLLDYHINLTGIRVDTESIMSLSKLIAEEEEELLLLLSKLTDGAVSSPRQVAASLTWIKEQGVELDNLQKQTLSEALKMPDLPQTVKRFINIRQVLGLSSVAKLSAMRNMAGSDDRVRGIFLYHGANTGRWAGRGVQPQNLPRGDADMTIEDVDEALSAARLYSYRQFKGLYGSPSDVAKTCLRGLLCADAGHSLYCLDYSSIEGRVLAWVADEVDILQGYVEGLDMYKLAAAPIYGVDYEEVTKEQRHIGKIIELACGYQGYVGAFNSMATAFGVVMDEDEVGKMIMKWRESRPRTVSLWRELNDKAMTAIRTGRVQSYRFKFGTVQFGTRGDFLHMKLPSGRLLSYNKPTIVIRKDLYDREKECIAFMGVDSMTNRWCGQHTYGGKITENLVQAIARDILAEAMLRVDSAGYKIVAHVHDEIVCEVPADLDTVLYFGRFGGAVSECPVWSKGLPISVEGWRGERYRKG